MRLRRAVPSLFSKWKREESPGREGHDPVEITAGRKVRDRLTENNRLGLRTRVRAVSYTHLRAHETVLELVCRLLLEKKKQIHNRHMFSDRAFEH